MKTFLGNIENRLLDLFVPSRVENRRSEQWITEETVKMRDPAYVRAIYDSARMSVAGSVYAATTDSVWDQVNASIR